MYSQYFNVNQVVPFGQELNDLVLAGRLEPNEEKRKDIYRELVNIITEEAISIPLYQEINTAFYRAGLKNVKAEAAVPVNRVFEYTY